MPDQKEFVHLHVHTEFSLLDGLSQIKKLAQRAAETGMQALAITDHGTMYGVIDFYQACKKQGVKPIIGMETYLARRGMTDRDPKLDNKPYHMLLLAKNQTGYQNLLKIASASQLEGYYYRPRIDHEFLAEHAEGLIATSGCLAAEIPRMVTQGREEAALQQIGWYKDVFGPENFFLELQSHDIEDLHVFNRWLYEHQDYADVPLVATNDVHYVLAEDFDAHDTLLCIQTGSLKAEQNRMRFESQTFHLRTPDEMWRLFAHVPEALANSLLIADMCNINLDSEEYHLPVFPVPEGYNAETYLRHLCEQGIHWRYESHADDPEVRDRLNYELQVIHDMGFDTYFLIVWDLCEFAKQEDIWWNVRGSGAGSVVAYCLGITNIDPLRNGLLFERFLNPGRVSMPDIDLDYPEDRRTEMIQYCAQKYGEDKVAAIITFGTMGSKAAIRDVGRAFDMPLPEVDRIARLIPSVGKPIKFEDALGDDSEKALPELKQVYASDNQARRLIDMARQLEGITRHASTHAAGVIVADKPLVEYLPLHRPTKGAAEDAPVKMVTQFPMETCEAIGLLKVDFLGLTTLTVMRRACEMIERYHGIRYDLSNIPYRSEPGKPEENRLLQQAFEMMGRGETIGVFQLESQGMRRMLTDMRPSIFEHIVAGIALYRPGPIEFIPQYNRRLHGEEAAEYRHPLLEPILKETYGICVYQEQIMQIAGQLFGYELGEADLMRRAVSKKKKGELLKHRQTFVERGPEHGIDAEVAQAIFKDIEFFARYGFNKSHAADYAVLTCQTAFLKCHYPHEYMAALMSVNRDDAAKVGLFAADCMRMNIEVLPPTINHSWLDFSIENQPGDSRAIRFGLGAIKNVGVAPLEHIIEQREQVGPFRDLDDFCHQVDTRIVTKRALESLIKVGALDEFAPRPTLLAAQERIISFSADHHQAKEVGQLSLFGEATGVEFGAAESILNALHDVEPISRREILNWEKELVGLYVTDHPLKPVMEQLQHIITHTNAELLEAGDALSGHFVRVAGLIEHVRRFPTKKGDMMGVLSIEDMTGTISAVMFPRTWRTYQDLIDEDAIVIVSGKADTSRGDMQIIVDKVKQEFAITTSAVELPDMKPAFSWLEDDKSEDFVNTVALNAADDLNKEDVADDSSYEDELSDAIPTTAFEDKAPVTPPLEMPVSESVPEPPSPRDAGIVIDREMPEWLAAEVDNGWSPAPEWDYHDDTGHILGVEQPEEEEIPPAEEVPAAFDTSGRLKPPQAPAARPHAHTADAPAAHTPPRRGHFAPPSDPEPEPGRLLTLYIQRTIDPAKDRSRIRLLHGFLTQYPGPDRFRFILKDLQNKTTCIEFPKLSIRINDDILKFAADKLGAEQVVVEDIE